MPIPESKDVILKELHSWENIIHSNEWIVFRNFLKDHCAFLQKEVNDHLRKHEDRAAGEALRAMDDANKMLTLITQRITALNKTKGT